MLTLKRLALIVLIVAIVDIVFMSFTFFTQILREPSKSSPISRQKSDNFSDTHDNYRNDPEWIVNTNHLSPKNEKLKDESITANRILPTVEIWSKAAIGHYLWQHILKGKSTKQTQFYHYGSKKFPDMEIKFRSGPSLMPQSLERFLSKNVDEFGRKHYYPTNIILVLNGRSQEKIDFAKTWLNCLKKLHQSEYDVAFNSGAIILGHEFCFNSWIKPYLASNGGPLKFLFIVYDWADVNDQEIFQWPLGVATYRDFPAFDPNRLNFDFPRPYACNFLGTVYPNSSREELLRVINKTSDVKCYTRPRFKWEPSESRETLNLYMQALRLSDLTLSPIGMNHECYRIYEALTFGSVPVIEHNINHVLGKKSHCDQNSAYRLLKRYDAPFIYVQNWTTDLTSILRRELELSPEAKVQRRIKVVKWYTDFQDKLRDHLFSVISNKFRF